MGHTSQSTLCECVGVFIPWHRSFRMRRPESWLCLWLDTFDMASSQSNRDQVMFLLTLVKRQHLRNHVFSPSTSWTGFLL